MRNSRMQNYALLNDGIVQFCNRLKLIWLKPERSGSALVGRFAGGDLFHQFDDAAAKFGGGGDWGAKKQSGGGARAPAPPSPPPRPPPRRPPQKRNRHRHLQDFRDLL